MSPSGLSQTPETGGGAPPTSAQVSSMNTIYFPLSFLAFISLLIFLYGVLKIMTGDRVLTDTALYGSRALIVDAQGNRDYTTIQAAINAAQAQTPAADSRWLVLVAPGEYQESLTLYDYIDVAGYANGYTSYIKCPASQPAIANLAGVTISNVRLGGDYDNIVQSGGSTDTIRFDSILVDLEAGEDGTVFQLLTGTIEIWDSYISAQQRVAYITAGTLKAYNSTLREYNTDGDLDEYAVLDIDGAATVDLWHCSVINEASAGSGGAAVLIQNASVTFKAHTTLFRKASGSESIATTVIPTIYLAACVANAAIDAAILGTHDVQVDSNY